MSRVYKKKYGAFQRHILAEFLTPKQLRIIDRNYNLAKAKREIERAITKIKP